MNFYNLPSFCEAAAEAKLEKPVTWLTTTCKRQAGFRKAHLDVKLYWERHFASF